MTVGAACTGRASGEVVEMTLAYAAVLLLAALSPTSGHDLVAAAGRGDLAAVRALIDSGADLEARNEEGYSALMLAAAQGHEQMVKVLLAAGAGVDARDDVKNTALAYAAAGGRLPVIRELIAAGADVNAEADHKVTPLMLAVANGRSQAASLLLQAGADPERAAANGVTPLLHAVEKGHEEAAAALLAGGADPDGRSPSPSKDTPLILAARADDAGMVRVLLEGGADVDARNWNRDTALVDAVRYGCREVVPLLVAAGADVDRKGGAGDSARKMAGKFGDEAVVAALEGRPTPGPRASDLTPPEAVPAPPGAIRVGEARIREPKKLNDVSPAYPEALRAARLQGIVILEAVIDTEGRVERAKVLKTPHPGFVPSAVDAVRQWRYTPTLLDDVAVPVIMTVTVNFKLTGERTVLRAVPDAASRSGVRP